MTSKTPPGVVAVLVNPDGAVVATASDFEDSRGGWDRLVDGQRARAVRALGDAMVAAHCSPVIGRMMTSYTVQSLLDEAVRKHRFRIEIVKVGHDAGEEEQG